MAQGLNVDEIDAVLDEVAQDYNSDTAADTLHVIKRGTLNKKGEGKFTRFKTRWFSLEITSDFQTSVLRYYSSSDYTISCLKGTIDLNKALYIKRKDMNNLILETPNRSYHMQYNNKKEVDYWELFLSVIIYWDKQNKFNIIKLLKSDNNSVQQSTTVKSNHSENDNKNQFASDNKPEHAKPVPIPPSKPISITKVPEEKDEEKKEQSDSNINIQNNNNYKKFDRDSNDSVFNYDCVGNITHLTFHKIIQKWGLYNLKPHNNEVKDMINKICNLLDEPYQCGGLYKNYSAIKKLYKKICEIDNRLEYVLWIIDTIIWLQTPFRININIGPFIEFLQPFFMYLQNVEKGNIFESERNTELHYALNKANKNDLYGLLAIFLMRIYNNGSFEDPQPEWLYNYGGGYYLYDFEPTQRYLIGYNIVKKYCHKDSYYGNIALTLFYSMHAMSPTNGLSCIDKLVQMKCNNWLIEDVKDDNERLYKKIEKKYKEYIKQYGDIGKKYPNNPKEWDKSMFIGKHGISKGYLLKNDIVNGIKWYDKYFDWDCKHGTNKKDNDCSVWKEKITYILLHSNINGFDQDLFNFHINHNLILLYLPTTLKNDPISCRLTGNKGRFGEWIENGLFKYKVKSWFVPRIQVNRAKKIINHWMDEDEYKSKVVYEYKEIWNILRNKAKTLNSDNISVFLKCEDDCKEYIYFWDLFLSLWYLLCFKGKTDYDDIFAEWTYNQLLQLLDLMKPVYTYISKNLNNLMETNNTNEIQNIFNNLNKQFLLSHGRIRIKLIHLLIDITKLNDDSIHFNTKAKLLQFLSNGYEKTDKKGWMDLIDPDSRGNRKNRNKNIILKDIQNSYSYNLDRLGDELLIYYNNTLFADKINYDKLILSIKEPKSNALILRQDSKHVLKRVKFGPMENDGIIKAKYEESMHNLGLAVRDISNEEISGSFNNAYVDYLLQIGEKIDSHFQKDMRKLFENTNGEYFAAPLKKYERCLQKLKFDYQNEIDPVGAHILDIVRNLVVFENIYDLKKAYQKLSKKFKVCRLKNNFIRNIEVPGNYRCLMVNILFSHPQNKDIKMICECQLTVRKIYLVRLKMHKSYKLFRGVLPEDSALLF